MRPILLLVVILAVAGFGGWRWYYQRGLEAAAGTADVETVTAEVRDVILDTVRVTGEVAPAIATDVKSEISGAIARLYVEEGAVVTNRQVLIELDRSELESQESELLRMIESSRLQAERARRDFERQQDLFAKGFVTQKSFDDAATELKLAENALAIEEARLQTLREKLVKTTIRAPHQGKVLECDLSEGQVIVGANSVSQGMVLMRIADLDRLVIRTDINEVDVARLKIGMPAEIRFDSIPQMALTGTVARIAPSAVKRGELRVFPVEVTCRSKDPRIRPGISANLILTIDAVESALAVLISAVFASEASSYVFLKQNERFVKRDVEVGINDATVVEIRSGLNPGDEVARVRPPAFHGEDDSS